MGLQKVKWSYKGLQGVTGGYRGLQGVSHVISVTHETHTYALFFVFFPIVPEAFFGCVI